MDDVYGDVDGMDHDEWSVLDSHRTPDGDVQATLWGRGWAVVDAAVADDEPLQWIWPPTTPEGNGAKHSPWHAPTRVTRRGDGRWRLEYGAAVAQRPDDPLVYAEGEALIADLERRARRTADSRRHPPYHGHGHAWTFSMGARICSVWDRACV